MRTRGFATAATLLLLVLILFVLARLLGGQQAGQQNNRQRRRRMARSRRDLARIEANYLEVSRLLLEGSAASSDESYGAPRLSSPGEFR